MLQITLIASLKHDAIGVPRAKELADGQLRAGQAAWGLRARQAGWGLWVDQLTRVPKCDFAAGVARVKAV